MTIINNIEYVMIGGQKVAVQRDTSNLNFASTLLISYADINNKIILPSDFTKFIMFGGVPLSITSFNSPIIDPSIDPTDSLGVYYAMDIIEITKTNRDINDHNTAQNPAARTIMLGNGRVSATKINNYYYLTVKDIGDIASAQNIVMLNGVIMGTGAQDELILNKTNYIINDIDTNADGDPDVKEAMIGGVPLRIGRIENKYYLIVYPSDNIS